MSSTTSTDKAVIVITRFPVPGETKTRLIPVLGPDGAARLHREMTERTVSIGRRFCDEYGAGLEIRYDGGSSRDMAAWLGDGTRYAPQGNGDLGLRMKRAAVGAIGNGAIRVIMIGVDIPGLQVDHLRKAFLSLETNDVVIGPARDGGYYLIGFSSRVPDVFEGVEWGTERVLEQTIERITGRGLRLGLLEVLDDIDLPGDIHLWDKVKNRGSE